MTSPEQERWKRVKERLRAEVGEDIYLSWFARMDLERVDERTAHLSVPTRFLKSWIQSHYTGACWHAGRPSRPSFRNRGQRAQRGDPPAPKAKLPEPPEIGPRSHLLASTSTIYAPLTARSRPATTLGGSPLDLQLTFDTFVVGRSNTLAHAARQVAVARRGSR